MIPVTSNTIRFRGMRGTLLEDDTKDEFIEKVLQMDREKYEKIYFLDDGWAGSYLFVNGKSFEFIECGSGQPILNHRRGMLE